MRSVRSRFHAVAMLAAMIALTLALPLLLGAGPDEQAPPTGLEVGQAAPEIVGKDINGKAMKLSDFRGKVVLLDFFGDW